MTEPDAAIDRRLRAILSIIDEARKLMSDLVVEDNLLVVERLTAWVELERRSAAEPIQ
jgi:hypothetical protein